MHITLSLDPQRLRTWQLVLAEELAALPGRTVCVSFSTPGAPLPAAIRAGLALEARATPHHVHPAMATVVESDFARFTSAPAPPDLLINLASGQLSPPAGPAVLTPLYDGRPGEEALWASMLRGTSPRLALYDSATGRVLEIGWPKAERTLALSRSAAEIVTRLVSGLLTTAASDTPERGLSVSGTGPRSSTAAGDFPALARKIAAFGSRTVWNRTVKPAQWTVAWRRLDGPLCHPAPVIADLAAYHTLADDGARYYADPFLFAHNGDVHLFVEELPYARGRAILSVCTLNPDGTADVPRPILETEHHLSYPQVFAHDGSIWMLPEASASGKLTLYRARSFPHVWEPAADLIHEPLHDATLLEHGGRYWIFAATQGSGRVNWGSSWDALSLYSAPALLGPWTAHPSNPVLIDARCARPAGPIYEIGGKLFRPAQDCSLDYGSALTIAEIDRLDGVSFTQRTVARVAFPERTRLLGPHTLSRLATPAGIIEAIDVFGTVSDLRAAGAGI